MFLKNKSSSLAYFIFFSFVLFVGGCTNAHQEFGSDKGEVCGSGDFNNFLVEFSQSVDFQKEYTLFPLQKMYVDKTADPEPLPVEQSIASLNEAVFPLIPTKEEINSIGLVLNVRVQQGRAEVNINKPDTDYLVKYFFDHNRCWGLFRIEDWSL